ncbi:uncharacterized protein [Onthophagus taurus]|uniref:uncharacterized protein n=1 Tax=Onthophagus taurus TaxID=166361 RepID=UPI0039BE9F40
MRVFVVSIISLCYFLTAYAVEEECKPVLTNLWIHDNYLVGVEFNTCSNAHSTKIKCVVGEDIIYGNTTYTEGAIELNKPISCEDDVKISVVAYDEDGLKLGESKIADVLPCGDCKAIRQVSYDDDLKITVLMTPQQPECIAKKFKIKLSIYNEIKYIDTYPDELNNVIKLSSALPCKAEVSIVGYTDNGVQLVESPITIVRKSDCEDCTATIVSVDYDDDSQEIIVSLIPPTSDCTTALNFKLKVRCSIQGKIVEGEVFADNTVGIVRLSSQLSCADAKISIVSYQEIWYDAILGESDSVDLLQCEECKPKIAGVTPDIDSIVYVSIIPPSSDCPATRFSLEMEGDCNIIFNNTLGICVLDDRVLDTDVLTAYINVYNEDTLVGQSDYVDFNLCKENCKAKIVGTRYDGVSRIYAKITIPEEEKCKNAAVFNLKYTIDGETNYVDIIDINTGMIQLAKPITNEDIKLSVVTYDEDGIVLAESDVISSQIRQCLN